MRFAGENLAPLLGRVDDERPVAVIPIRRFFVLRVGVRVNLLAVRFGIEVLLERVFTDPAFEARPGQLAALEQRGLVIAGPAVATRAGLAEIARQHQRQIRGAIRLRRMKPMVDALALMN